MQELLTGALRRRSSQWPVRARMIGTWYTSNHHISYHHNYLIFKFLYNIYIFALKPYKSHQKLQPKFWNVPEVEPSTALLSIEVVTLKICKSSKSRLHFISSLLYSPESVMMKKTSMKIRAPVSRRVKEKRQMSPIILNTNKSNQSS